MPWTPRASAAGALSQGGGRAPSRRTRLFCAPVLLCTPVAPCPGQDCPDAPLPLMKGLRCVPSMLCRLAAPGRSAGRRAPPVGRARRRCCAPSPLCAWLCPRMPVVARCPQSLFWLLRRAPYSPRLRLLGSLLWLLRQLPCSPQPRRPRCSCPALVPALRRRHAPRLVRRPMRRLQPACSQRRTRPHRRLRSGRRAWRGPWPLRGGTTARPAGVRQRSLLSRGWTTSWQGSVR